MKIAPEKLRELLNKNRSNTDGKSNFRQLLDNLKSGKSDFGPSQSRTNPQASNWNKGNFENGEADFNVLKDMDAQYWKKGVKKKTLAETFAKRFGTDVKKRIEKFRPLVLAKAKKYNLDPNLLAGLIKQESNFNPYAVSHCGAMGLGQLMPETARGLGVVDPFNASQNMEGAAKYLRQMLDTFGGNTTKALAAYNAGPGAVRRHGGVPPYRETQNYVKAVHSHTTFMKNNDLFPEEKPGFKA